MAYVEIDRNYQVRAAVVFPNILADSVSVTPETRLEEAVGLARAINLDVAYREIVKLREIKPSAYFSRGFVDRVKPLFETEEIELMIVDASLTPIQQRNLEKALKIKVIDRTALILEIFGERAKTKEGTQIELDRRIIDDKIVRIRKELEKVKKTRELQRSARKRIPYPVVALVGYTNAGKSTLFNCLSSAGVFAENLLFATLDTTMRRLTLPSGREVILSDTVGFISDLPHELVMAFRATLEEVLEADVVVQVLDAANPGCKQQRRDVLTVLAGLGLDKIEHQPNYLEVYNKIDLAPSFAAPSANAVKASALTGEGCKELLRKLDDVLAAGSAVIDVNIPSSDGKTISWLHRNGEVLSCLPGEEFLKMSVRLDAAAQSRLTALLKNAAD